MGNKDLTNYIKRAMELEVAIYTHGRLITEHNKIVEGRCPAPPKKMVTKKPVRPREPEEPKEVVRASNMGILLLVLVIMLFSVLFIVIADGIISPTPFILGFAAFVSPVIIFLVWYKKRVMNEYKGNVINFSVLLREYEEEFARCEIKDERLEIMYNEELEKYKNQLTIYEVCSEQMKKRHDDTQKALICALEEHYSQGVIFPKYRNIIAVSAFYDYLASGRCDSLEGASGAYNLYETELRQNIIIAQLSLILKNINSIKDNQYSLYQELSKSNAEVNKIIYEVRELRDDTKMYAYLNSAMALAVATNI